MGVKSLKIENGYYVQTDEPLELFDNNRCTIIYGKNGAGKSTISHAFWNEKTGIPLEISETGSDFKHLITPNIKGNIQTGNNIFVYNNDYLNKKIRFNNSDGTSRGDVEGIVMFEDQKKHFEELKKLKRKQNESSSRINDLNTNQDIIKNLEKKQIADLEKLFRESWADNERILRNKKNNSRVTIDILKKLYQQYPEYKNFDLKSFNFKQQLTTIESVLAVKLPSPIFLPDNLPSEIEDIFLSLVETPDKLTVSEEFKQIVDLLSNESLHVNQQETIQYLQSEPKYCRLCLQKLDDEYVLNVLSALKEVQLNKQIEESASHLKKYIVFLKSAKLNNVPIFWGEYKKEIVLINEYIDDFNQKLEEIILSINTKISSPYVIDNFVCRNWSEVFNHLKIAKENLNKLISNFQAKKSKNKNETNQLQKSNTLFHLKKYSQNFETIRSTEKELKKNKDDLESETQNKISIQKEIDDLQPADIQIATNIINDNLKQIFLEKNRLTLSLNSSKTAYNIFVRGQSVSINKLSDGEKNAISFSYFLAQLYENKKINERIDDSILLVIDDPISSLDGANIVGMHSLISSSIRKLLNKNDNETQILLLTHSASVFSNFEKTLKNVSNDLGLTNIEKKFSTKKLILRDKKLQNADKFDFSYKSLLKNVWIFACADQNLEEKQLAQYHSVGNDMRRALEAYATFNFGIGMEKLTKSPKIIDCIQQNGTLEESALEIIESTLFNIEMNSDSHAQNAVNFEPQNTSLNKINVYETQKMARMILIFLDTIHFAGLTNLLDFTDNEEETKRIINNWKQVIF